VQFTNFTLLMKKLGSLHNTVLVDVGHYETHIEYLNASSGLELMLEISGPGKYR